MGVIELGDDLHLPLKQLRSLSGILRVEVEGRLAAHDFYGNLAANAAILGQIDLAHPPTSQHLMHLIATKLYSFK